MNKTKKQLKAMLSYDLEERLDALRDIQQTMDKYQHVFELDKEKLSVMVNLEIQMTLDILEERSEY
jgi:hypothetical protein